MLQTQAKVQPPLHMGNISHHCQTLGTKSCPEDTQMGTSALSLTCLKPDLHRGWDYLCVCSALDHQARGCEPTRGAMSCLLSDRT